MQARFLTARSQAKLLTTRFITVARSKRNLDF